MNVICFQDEAFYSMIEEVVARLKDKQNIQGDKWISDSEAMALLKIKSKTTLQNMRDEGKIRFSQPQKKIILYDRESIIKFLDKHARDTF